MSLYKTNRGDGVHLNRLMLMTPTGYIVVSVGVLFFVIIKKGEDFIAVSLAIIMLLGLPVNKLFEKLKMPKILGFIFAAVYPAIVVPSMLKLIENNLGEAKGIPTLILAGASIDDVFAITILLGIIVVIITSCML